jgi:DNA polymerase
MVRRLAVATSAAPAQMSNALRGASVHVVTIDFETYFDSEYTLSKMTTEEYVRDPRFDALGAAICENGRVEWFSPKDLRYWLTAMGDNIAMLAHHAHFDGLILSHHFDFRPKFWLDTLSMARVLFDSSVKKGLGDLSERLGLAPKTVPYDAFKGRHWDELDPATQQAVASGACHDCVLTKQIADLMMSGKHEKIPYPFPVSELQVIDLTVKMFVDPILIGDVDALGAAWLDENKATHELFTRLNEIYRVPVVIGPAELRKDACFAWCLEQLGVEPEQKTTPKGNEKYAFAKSDYFMQDLLYEQDEDIALLAEARLKAQSSIYRTRIERYGWMATRGPLCVYLAYAAAHTRRWGGGDKTNFQNLPRPDPYRPQKGALRRAIKAP